MALNIHLIIFKILKYNLLCTSVFGDVFVCLFYLVSFNLFHFAAPPVTNIQPVTTKPGQYIATENTITIDINTEYFKNDENGKQVFFGIAVCAESKCEGKILK